MNLKRNIEYLLQKKKLSTDEFLKKFGLASTEVAFSESAMDVLIRVSYYFQVSIDDLVKLDFPKGELQTKDHPKVLAITLNENQRENIEFVPVKARAGYMTGYGNPVFIAELQKISLPILTQGTFRAFEISGDSMPPVASGSIVIGRYIENYNEIQNLKTLIIITRDEGIVYKRVINRLKDKNQLILLSDNPKYAPYTVNKSDILEIWSYRAHLNMADYADKLPDFLYSVSNQLENIEVEQLKELIHKNISELEE